MDEEKKQQFRNIFWEMNEISSRTDTRTETVVETFDDGNGNPVETESTVTKAYRYITAGHRTAEEMAGQLGFDEAQRERLAELLDEENDALWSQVFYGIPGGDGGIAAVALSQVGNVAGNLTGAGMVRMVLPTMWGSWRK